jgi:hypothetical protein
VSFGVRTIRKAALAAAFLFAGTESAGDAGTSRRGSCGGALPLEVDEAERTSRWSRRREPQPLSDGAGHIHAAPVLAKRALAHLREGPLAAGIR